MMKHILAVAVYLLLSSYAHAQQPPKGTIVHDPVMIKQGYTYYIFCTGMGITEYSSKDMKNWERHSPVFSSPPQWALDAVPGFKGHIWAPDISYHNGKYYLFYAVSAFGKNTSCIGLAVNKTLDTASADYKWQDLGKVIQSVPGRDLWNAIDPNLILDGNDTPYLVFGSFWDGMKMVKLNSNYTAVAQPEEWYTVARRNREFALQDSMPGNAAIEAPFIFKKGKFYYLFVSWDYCCRGEKSDYKVVVGRSEMVAGPYLDKTGKFMFEGGGSLVVQGDNKIWNGTGHNAAYTIDGKDYIIYHGYDAADKGKPKLVIEELEWEDDWPVAPSQKIAK